jgi:hypothetical protein
MDSDWNNCAENIAEYSVPVTSGKYGENIEWNYANNKLSITGHGDMPDDSCTPWSWLSDSTKVLEIEEGITSIRWGMCYNFDSLTVVNISNGVTSIGADAFYDCHSLTSITIPNSVKEIEEYAFGHCEKLQSVMLSNKIEIISESIFEGCTGLTSITIPNGVKEIWWDAFAGCTKLNSITLPSTLEVIKSDAFDDCKALYDIYCYAKMPPAISESSFVNYNAYVHVPCDSKRYYQADMVWSLFPNIQCIESDEVKTDGVVVTPSTNDVTIIWPTSDSADTYTIIIKQGNDVFCTLTFNADGQLLNIAFAPSRDGNNHPAQYAAQAGNGYRFTVTGLEEATHYTYNIDVRDAANQTINSYSGEFTTQSNVPSSVDNTPAPMINCTKTIRDGQLLILHNGKTYTLMGAPIQ